MIIQYQGGNELSVQELDVNIYGADDLIQLKMYDQTLFRNFDDPAYIKGLAREALVNGRQRETKTDLNFHVETGSYYAPITVKTSTGGTSNSCTITFDATLTSGGKYLSGGLELQSVFLPNSMVQVMVQTKTQLTTSPTGSMVLVAANGVSINWSALMPVGSQLGFYIQNAWPESPFLTGRTFNDTRYQTATMEFQTNTPTMGASQTNQAFEIPNQGGGPGKPWAIDRLLQEMVPIHEIGRGFQMVWGTGNTYTSSTGELIPTSQGFYSMGQTFGEEFNIAPYSIVLSDFDNICASLVHRQVGTEVTIWNGYRLSASIDKFLRSTMVNGAVVYASFSNNGSLSADAAQARAVDLGYGSFRYNDFSFHKKDLVEASHPFLTDITGDPFEIRPNSAILLPTGGGMTMEGGQNVYVPAWEYLYKLGRSDVNGNYQRVRVYDVNPVNQKVK